jgi:hypothetical protein
LSAGQGIGLGLLREAIQSHGWPAQVADGTQDLNGSLNHQTESQHLFT